MWIIRSKSHSKIQKLLSNFFLIMKKEREERGKKMIKHVELKKFDKVLIKERNTNRMNQLQSGPIYIQFLK